MTKLDSGKKIARLIRDIIGAHGVRDIVCSPGSRNTPLIIAAEAGEKFKKHVVIDERSAGFVALGIAQTTRRPVALICTSGTALLNYAPAVAEAYYQAIPLIIISADRPLEWIDQDDSQTIKQFGALANIVKNSYDLSDSESREDYYWYADRTVNDAMLLALRERRGPVHINVRLSPPLNTRVPAVDNEGFRIISEVPAADVPSKENIKMLAEELAGKKILMVAGFMPPDEKINRGVNKFRTHSNVAVMAETISNLHLPPQDYMVDSILSALVQESLDKLSPDIVISIGGALVSRMLKNFIRDCASKNPNLQHWSVGYQHTTVDCFKTLTRRIECNPGKFLNLLTAEFAHFKKINNISIDPSISEREILTDENDSRLYSAEWHKLRIRQMADVRSYCESACWSDMKAFSLMLNNIPPSWNLYLSNGTAIRYAQILSEKIPHAEYCNRGVSGIEGSTSTALGGELGSNTKTLLISGDMSFSYDLGGLAAANRLDSKLKIVVINNQGGGIFRFIKATSDLECREEYLCAPPKLDISKISDTFNFEYYRAENEEQLKSGFRAILNSESRAILEVITPPEVSTAILKNFLK